jgi:hypothetical protein
MDQGEPGLDYDDPNLNPLECDICKQKFDSLDKLGEHQKQTGNKRNMIEGKNRAEKVSRLYLSSLSHLLYRFSFRALLFPRRAELTTT